MKRQTAYRANLMEVLEDRRLFSTSPVAPLHDPAPPQSPSMDATTVATPNIVGSFTGISNDTNEKLPGKLTAVILTQSASGEITGYVVSKYPGNPAKTTDFTGQISGDSVIINTSTTAVHVTVSHKGTVMTGYYTFKSSDDSSIGHFVMTREA
jgi:hypothetical protein